MSRRLALCAVLAALAACETASPPNPAPTPQPVAVRSALVLIPGGHPEDASLLVARYHEWDAEGQPLSGIELDHGHGPTDEAADPEVDEEPVVLARVGGEDVPVQAVDADGDRVLVDLDALPPGHQVLRLAVIHDGLTSDWLEVAVLDRRLAGR